MKKLNNKGITILELIISIFILTTVIFIGYKIINKSTITIKDQGHINKGQLTINDLNKYLTKDLEQATSIKLTQEDELEPLADTKIEGDQLSKEDSLLDGMKKLIHNIDELETGTKLVYLYTIRDNEFNKLDDDYIKYIVEIERIKNYIKYTVKRVNKQETIEFMNGKVIFKDILPFSIVGNDPYKVNIGYEDKRNTNSQYEFEISSRYNKIKINKDETTPVDPPSLDDIEIPDGFGDYYVLGFWTANDEKLKEDNLYTWVSEHGNIIGEAYATQDSRGNEKFNIEGNARPGNNSVANSYIGYNSIENDPSWKGQVKDVSISDKDVSKISIYVSEHATLEAVSIMATQGNSTISIPLEKNELKQGWNHCEIKKNGNSKINFKVKGVLSIDKEKVNSGYAYVVYEREGKINNDQNVNGDIIFEITEQDSGIWNWEVINNMSSTPNKHHSEYKGDEISGNFNIYIATDDQNNINPHIMGVSLNDRIRNEHIQCIKAINIKSSGDIELSNLNIDGNKIYDNNGVYRYEFNKKGQFNIGGNFKIQRHTSELLKHSIIINFEYDHKENI